MLLRLVVLVAEADQGVAPVIVMPAVPSVDRWRYVTKRDLTMYGYTDECESCTPLAAGMHNAKVPHDDRCRDRVGELRGTVSQCLCEQSQRLKSRRRSVWMYHRPDQLSTYQKSGPSGPGSKEDEMHTVERDSKRVQFAESRGQKRHSEDVGRTGGEHGRTTSRH